MKRTITLLAAAAALVSATGCANMTPEQNARVGAAIGAGLMGAAAVADAYANSRRPAPVYVAPVYVAPARVWQPYCWQSAVTGQWMGCWR